jgi:hypothetical protein
MITAMVASAIRGPAASPTPRAPVACGAPRRPSARGCWGSSNALQYGAGPAGATTPTIQYESVTFTGGLTYQLLMTDARIIEIDNLNRVNALPAL